MCNINLTLTLTVKLKQVIYWLHVRFDFPAGFDVQGLTGHKDNSYSRIRRR